jgi:hypothetical protein
MKLSWRMVLAFFVSALALAACLPPFLAGDEKDRLSQATAAAIPGVEHGSIVISDVDRAQGHVTWRALTPLGEFECRAAHGLQPAMCSRR